MLLSITAYIVMMQYEFNFEIINLAFLVVLLACVCFPLLHFKPHEFKSNSAVMKVVKYPVFLTGRRTLEFYVLHLLIFMYLVTYVIGSNNLFS